MKKTWKNCVSTADKNAGKVGIKVVCWDNNRNKFIPRENPGNFNSKITPRENPNINIQNTRPSRSIVNSTKVSMRTKIKN